MGDVQSNYIEDEPMPLVRAVVVSNEVMGNVEESLLELANASHAFGLQILSERLRNMARELRNASHTLSRSYVDATKSRI